ncbi:hypothetical protein Pan241w_20910 [Gimesia alba]|uniref:Tetratricopeptide repeat protein n=1 Tax=Gimesia alba TaxID=2527973 RepID=A0A517RDR3_9PLAN|nr:hypothetical protein [Gimesia alba]QDT42010.1 hypothetical protein Pan241w_20910 [Gimesia alba]
MAFWNDYFSKRKPDPALVNDLIFNLHQAGKHEHVIAAINAALIHNQSQPWMYDVLALSMEIVGRPKQEIQRVLLSRIDFSATDVPSMVYSAAYLSRFNADEQALKLYQQASKLQPARPEPYIMGLRLAEKLQDAEAILWAATGILTHVWVKDHQALHEKALNALADLEQSFNKAGRKAEAARVDAARKQALERDLKLELTWNGDGDLDLIVEEPQGTVCSFEAPLTAGGGVLLKDGYGPKQENCKEEYVCAYGFPGTYVVRVRYVSGNIVGQRARLKVTRYRGSKHPMVQSRIVPLAKDDQLIRIDLSKGRRSEKSEVVKPAQNTQKTSQLRNRMQLRQPLSNGSRSALKGFRVSRQAGISTGRQTPFVTGVQNVGGVANQPVISVIPEGISLSGSAVVSPDRRYVRLSLSPQFTNVTEIFTFSFLQP